MGANYTYLGAASIPLKKQLIFNESTVTKQCSPLHLIHYQIKKTKLLEYGSMHLGKTSVLQQLEALKVNGISISQLFGQLDLVTNYTLQLICIRDHIPRIAPSEEVL
jgi:hypothetical protein